MDSPPLAEPASRASLEPVREAERLEIVDVLRGVAVLGILLVNMQLFFAPMGAMVLGEHGWASAPDRVAEALIRFLAQGKFYTMFSLLFGLGMAIQMRRAAARGISFPWFFSRRLFWLLILGLAHAFLIWFGDILAQYALLGYPLLLFRNRKDRTLMIWGVVLLLLPLVLFGAFLGLAGLARLDPHAAARIDEQLARDHEQTRALVAEARQVYANGGFVEILAMRAREVRFIYGFVLFGGWSILGMFVIGLLLGRRRFFDDLDANLPRLLRAVPWLLAVGIAANVTIVISGDTTGLPDLSPLMLLRQACHTLGGPTFCLVYVAGLCALYRRERWRRRLGVLAPVGRMALTNYLAHSLVLTTLSYGYGLGWYGRVSIAAGLGLALAAYAVQIVFSHWWLARFRFGPVEWLWRSLTYWRPQPMLRRAD